MPVLLSEQPNVTPLLRINEVNVPLTAQNFSWSLTPGPLPFSNTFRVPSGQLSDQINSLVNPVSITMSIKVAVKSGDQFTEKDITFENLFLHDRRIISDFEHEYRISDGRYFLQGKKLAFSFNETRVKVQRGVLQAPTKQKVGLTNPNVLRQPFDQFNLGRYVKNSVKADGKPFTISEIIQNVLGNIGVAVAIDPDLLVDGDYVLENVREEMGGVFTVVANLLRAGRLQMGITPKGVLYVYSIDFFDKSSIQQIANLIQNDTTTGPGRIYEQDLKRNRPSKIRVLFEKMQEVRVKLQPNSRGTDFNPEIPERPNVPIEIQTGGPITQEKVDTRNVIACINVIRVPFVNTNSNLFGTVQIGEYFPFVEYIQQVLATNNELTIDEINKFWWNALLEREIQTKILLNNNVETDSLASMIASAIRGHYRQVFMIDPFYIDVIKKWENKLVNVVSNYSGYRPPSPLFADFTFFPRGRDIAVARGRVTHQAHSRSYFVDVQDPQRQRPTAGTISIVNADLGIFQVQYPPVSDTMIAEIVPSGLSDSVVAAASLGTGKLLLQQVPLADEFTMETVISVVWNYDNQGSFESDDINAANNDAKYFAIEFDYSAQNAQGPDIKFLSTREYARINEQNEIINADIVEAIAEAEAAKIFNQFIDRFIGYAKLPGIVRGFRLNGNMKAITFELTPNGANTIFDLSEIPFAPELEQQLSANVRAYLLKQVTQGGP